MYDIKSFFVNVVFFIFLLFVGTPSNSMMDCTGKGFYCDDFYQNGTILCRPTNFTCTYTPSDDQWSWWQSSLTYAAVGAVFNVILDNALKVEWKKNIAPYVMYVYDRVSKDRVTANQNYAIRINVAPAN